MSSKKADAERVARLLEIRSGQHRSQLAAQMAQSQGNHRESMQREIQAHRSSADADRLQGRFDDDDGDEEEEEDEMSLRERRRRDQKSRVGGGAAGIVGDFWRCPSCTVANETILSQCLVCNAARPDECGPAVADAYVCAVCTYVNGDPDASQCEMCGTKRDAGGSGQAHASSPSKAKGKANGGDGESKEDNEMRGGSAFVMGEASPPPLKRQTLVREHLAFLAGIEEAFGSIHIAPALLHGVERLVRKPFEALVAQYEVAPPSSSSSSASAAASAASASVITPDILHALLKALVFRSASSAMRVQKQLDLLLACCTLEEEQMRVLECNRCHAHGSDTQLHCSEECGPGARHAFCLQCTHHYVMELVESKQCGQVVCPFEHTDADGTVRRCGREVDPKWVRRCLSTREYSSYLDECFSIMVSGGSNSSGGGAPGGALGHSPGGAHGGPGSGSGSSYMHCPNQQCRAIMEVLPPHGLVVPLVIKEVDEQGKALTPEAWLHFQTHRVRWSESTQI